MTPFYTRYPELAFSETRTVRLLQAQGALPPGEYGFIEYYCEEPDCDCRRTLLAVVEQRRPKDVLAYINFGWESVSFYEQWLHGDKADARDIVAGSLDPLQRQSRHAPALLRLFQELLRSDANYVARLARHYAIFKGAQAGEPQNEPSAKPTQTLPEFNTVPDILRQLSNNPDLGDFAPFEAALKAAEQHREEIIPELIAVLERVADNPEPFWMNGSDCLPLFAILLLAQFRETRARECFWRFFSLPEKYSLDLTGDLVTEQGAAILASVCGGDPAPLMELFRNPKASIFVREQALYGLLVQKLWQERPHAAVLEDLRNLFQTFPKSDDGRLWASLIIAVLDGDLAELVPEARQAFDEGLVDADSITRKHFEQELQEDGQRRWQIFAERNHPINAVDEACSWLCWQRADEEEDWEDEEEEWAAEDLGGADEVFSHPPLPQYPPPSPYAPPAPYIAPAKVGRNDPCPCGSGRKYKKCCGA